MVSKLTFFEANFESAQFGPKSIETEPSEEETEPTMQAESSGSKSRLVTFLQGATVFVVMFVTLWLLLSRLDRSEHEPERL